MKLPKIFNWGSGKAPEFGNLASHPNARSRDRLELAADILKKKKVLIELKQLSQSLSQQEIADWRTANRYALNFENPKRNLLYDIYYDAMLDNHLLGAIRNRKLKVMGVAFKIVDDSGKENEEATKLLRSRWFKSFMSLALDSIFYGHSLIQLGDIVRDTKLRFTHVELIPRPHVIPEYHVVVRETMDEPKQGHDYLKPPFSDWAISVGNPKELGLLLPVAKDTISKKYALQFWDQFAEIFGMPIRVGKSSTRNKKDIDQIEKMLDEMGSAAWGLFPEGTEIEIVETKRGDAFNVYDKRIERANSEISKAILGQTMTMDDGSSRSQAQVHADVAEDIYEADADFLKDVINDDLIPVLVKHGFPLGNLLFEWNTAYQYSPKEMKEVEEMLLTHFEIDPSYFRDKYGIEITGIKQNSTPDNGEKKKLIRLVSRPVYEGARCCAHDHKNYLELAKPSIDRKKINDHLLRLVWDNRAAVYSYEYFEWLNNIYLHALTSGREGDDKLKLAGGKGVRLDFETPDYMTMQMFELNIFGFSAHKSAGAVKELNVLARENDTFNEFRKKAESHLFPFYNENTLRTEYNHAWATSQNAANYNHMIGLKEQFPTWMYQTVGDERVRAAHKVLHGMKFKAGDPAFDTIFPPNGWNCRCYVKPLTGVPGKYATKKEAELALAGSAVDKNGVSELNRMVKYGFNKNRAKERSIFDIGKAYWKGDLGKKLTFKDQGLEIAKNMRGKAVGNIAVKNRSKEFADNWWEKNSGGLTDYNKRKVTFSKQALDNHTNTKHLAEGRQNLIEFIPDILTSPSEVYMTEYGRNKSIQLKYVKHYKNKSVLVMGDIKDGVFDIRTWFEDDKNKFDRDWRMGILIRRL